MTSGLILVVAVIYASVSLGYALDGMPWHSLMWAAYSVANIGLYKMG